MEGIGVLHHEFPGPHDAEPGPDLVPELGLDLVEIGRQLFVTAYLAPDQIGDDLFMGRAQAEVPLVAVL